MKKYTTIAILASFFGLWMDSYFSTQLQIISGFFLIFTFGILHGANDLLLINNINVEKTSKSLLTILGYYLVVVLLGVILFYSIPQLALVLFIIVSAYHFGEQQWQELQFYISQWLVILFQFCYGLLILLLLFNFHVVEVQQIIFNIAAVNIPNSYFWVSLQITGSSLLLVCAYFYIKVEKVRSKLFIELFYMVLFTIIFKSSSLIWGFAIYFVLWHSIPSIIDQIKFLDGSFSNKNFISYCRSAGIYWLISILGITLIYYVFREQRIFNALFFSFLAAITFPHTIVITRMFRGDRNANQK